MLKQVVSLTSELDNQTNWFDYYAIDFENIIARIIANDLIENYGDKIYEIKLTDSQRDDGKDILILTKCSIEIMGVLCEKNPEKDFLKIIIECKTTKSHDRVSLEKFSKNILIADEEKDLDYFILLVNTSITPHAFYEVLRNCISKNIKFILINQFILAKYLTEKNVKENFYHYPKEIPSQTIQYQICNGRVDGVDCFELFLYIRNNENKAIISELKLLTDRNWELQNNPKKIILNKNESICEKLTILKKYNDGINEVSVNFTINDKYQQINIKNPGIQFNFETPFCGYQHKKIVNDLNECLRINNKFDFHFICGEAGIGKTRIIDELIKIHTNKNYYIYHDYYQENQPEKSFLNLLKWCKKKNILFEEASYIGYCDLICSIRPLYTKLLIIIEDIHHANKKFFDDIIDLIRNRDKITIPIEFILVGRDDNSFLNEDFFSFKNWVESNYTNNMHTVMPLKDEECKKLIRNIILEIPDSALDKIHKLSNNNPFYVVQFIEYMLDLDFINIINRNTVGIINLEKFTSNDYLPLKIEDLIEKRVHILKNIDDKCYDFLQVTSYFGFSFHYKLAYDFFGENNIQQINKLLEKRFLKIDNNDQLSFEHETIYIYFKYRIEKEMKRIALLISEHLYDCLAYLSDFQKGKYYLFLEEKDMAKHYFDEIFKALVTFNNISSQNLPKEYEQYLLCVYELSEDYQQKTNILKSLLYLNIHHFSYGHASNQFQKVQCILNTYHKNDNLLKTTFYQMQAHFYLNNSMLLRAEKQLLELQAIEKVHPEYFTDETRFELFDRLASLYTRYNYPSLATLYNDLAIKCAKQTGDDKLKALALMMSAKINYYNNSEVSYKYFDEVLKIYKKTPVKRLECQVKLSISIIRFFIDELKSENLSNYIKHTFKVYKQSIDENYPITIIRCCLSLAVYYYLDNDLINSNKFADKGINISVSSGISKIIPYFYNLKAIISCNQNHIKSAVKYFDTMIYYLQAQNLLFLGACTYCYPNMPLITNYIIFIKEYQSENHVYSFYDKLTYYEKLFFENSYKEVSSDKGSHQFGFGNHEKLEFYQKDLNRILQGYILFSDKKYPVKDHSNKYNLVQF